MRRISSLFLVSLLSGATTLGAYKLLFDHNGKEGIVIKSKQELIDEGDELPPSSSLFDEPDEIDMVPAYEKVKGISNVLDKQLEGIVNKDSITATKLVRAAQNLMGQGSLDADQLGQIKEALDV